MCVIYRSAYYDAVGFGKFRRGFVDDVVEYTLSVLATMVACYASAYVAVGDIYKLGVYTIVVECVFKLGKSACRTPVDMGASVEYGVLSFWYGPIINRPESG